MLFIGFEEPEIKDGANLNTGQKKGLWALFEKDREDKSIQIPFLKMWCTVHRSALAWETLTTNVIELKKYLGYLYSRFQKQIQSDDILIFDLEDKRNTLVKIIEKDSVQITSLHNIELQDKIKFSEFVTPDELKKCYRFIFPDYQLIDFVASYQEACTIEELKGHTSINILKIVLKNESWKSLSTSLARIFAAKPHSADV
ncbi:hypothetical protein AGLY_014041 [Aphis glycines]|uniref:Uncharacterized protein n=1 Tax=Aphis glycines TaxID=307491 RepID=A0A6G0T6L8_APHGL|nr:hypothetical protein AGLY_014041 [Aphis glycines]